MGVWRTEVSVLNRLSRRLSLATEADDEKSGQEGGREIEESEYEAWCEEIRDAVKTASKARDAKGRKVDGAGKKAKKTKRKKGEEDENIEDEDDSCVEEC